MNLSIIPDSPNWLFTNSRNVVALTQSLLVYSAHKKIVLVSIQTGKVQNIIFPGKDVLITFLTAKNNLIAGFCSDNFIRI